MFRSFVALLLLLAFATPILAAEVTVAEQVAKMKTGEKIKVALVTGEVLKGHLTQSTPQQLTLDPATTPGTPRSVQFSEVRSVKPDRMSRKAKVITSVAVVWVVVAIVGSRLV